MIQATVCRILGNEMPPRDTKGGRMAALRAILDDEVPLESAQRLWLVNRILDDDHRGQTVDLLSEYRQSYVLIPFDLSLEPTVTVMRGPGVSINAARNAAITIGHVVAPWSVVLDGDCFFTETADWEVVLRAMESGQTDYLSIPHMRLGDGKLGEPMLAFHRNAKHRFDESLLFGNLDKLDLCFKLGHDTTPYSGHLQLNSNAITQVVGRVTHYSTGAYEVEHELEVREKARLASFRQLAERLRVVRDTQSPDLDKINRGVTAGL